jgi:hypothetical protein
MNMPKKWAIKNKNRWFVDCLGFTKKRMALCIPYPNNKKSSATTKITILFNSKFGLSHHVKHSILPPTYQGFTTISLALSKAAEVGFSPLIICAMVSIRSSWLSKRIEVVIRSFTTCLYTK